MTQTIKKPPLGIMLAAVAAGVLSAQLPLFLLAAPGLFGYLLLAGGGGMYAAAVGVCGLGLYVLEGVNGLWVLAVLLPAPLCLRLMLGRKASWFNTTMLLAAIFTLLFYLSVNLQDILEANAPYHTVQQACLAMWQQLQTEMQPFMQGLPEQQKQMELMGTLMRASLAEMPTYMTAALFVISGAAALANVLLCAKLCKGAKVNMALMRPFGYWQVPKSFASGALILAAGCLAVVLMELPTANAVLTTVGAIIICPFAVQGLSAVWFMMRRRKNNGLFIVMLILLLVFSFVYSVFSLAILGVAEQWLHLRRRIIERENNADV